MPPVGVDQAGTKGPISIALEIIQLNLLLISSAAGGFNLIIVTAIRQKVGMHSIHQEHLPILANQLPLFSSIVGIPQSGTDSG